MTYSYLLVYFIAQDVQPQLNRMDDIRTLVTACENSDVKVVEDFLRRGVFDINESYQFVRLK